MTNSKYPTLAEVAQIAAVQDPVIRNLQITQCYHEMSLPLAARTASIANWCTFATWASKQAGQTIRKEDLARALEVLLRGEQTAALAAAAQHSGSHLNVVDIARLIWKAWDPREAFNRSSDAVARGNLKVFAEIGAEFARFYAACLDDPVYNPQKIDNFCSGLRPGDPPDGQRFLRQAFQHCYQALFETDSKTRTELMLLANLEIGFHEQTRLQPEINAALSAPVIDPNEFRRELLKELYPGRGWLSDAIRRMLGLFGRSKALNDAIDEFVAAARRQAHGLITETLMTINLPGPGLLRLGADLPDSFPPALQAIANPDLLALLAQIDPTPNSTAGSGAQYWGDLDDRLHFIAEMFRCYEVSSHLFTPPFNPAQAAALKDGRRPDGRL